LVYSVESLRLYFVSDQFAVSGSRFFSINLLLVLSKFSLAQFWHLVLFVVQSSQVFLRRLGVVGVVLVSRGGG
jgi:hypothetical protein